MYSCASGGLPITATVHLNPTEEPGCSIRGPIRLQGAIRGSDFPLTLSRMQPASPRLRLHFANHHHLLPGTHSAMLAWTLPGGWKNSFRHIYFYEYIFLFGTIIKKWWNSAHECKPGCLTLLGSSAEHYKGKLHSAGEISTLPQVKNIVALLKSACKASYIIRMFKY